MGNVYPNTKCGILGLVFSLFDPLGIVGPVLLESELVIQEL